MSKMDGLRAMREARYQAATTRSSTPSAPPREAPKRTERPTPAAAAAQGDAAPALCGHKAISGRTCTREHGHAAKSHRYS